MGSGRAEERPQLGAAIEAVGCCPWLPAPPLCPPCCRLPPAAACPLLPLLQGMMKEMLENIEQTRTVWHMQLDHQRNRVLRINLLIRWGGGVAAAACAGCWV